MRIECENCNAAFAIGDGILSDQPIGAQCPYCGHVKIVQLDPNAPKPPPAVSDPFQPGDVAGDIENRFGSSSGDDSAPISAPDEKKPAPNATCQVCGTLLADEFDKVIGLCEAHQRDRSEMDAPEPSLAATDAPDETPSPAQAQSTPRPKSGPGALRVQTVPRKTTIAQATKSQNKFGTRALLLFLAGIILALAASYAPKIEALITGQSEEKPRPIPPNPMRAMLDGWKIQNRDVAGTAKDYVDAAEAAYLEDSAPGYARADQSLQRALLLDENNARAVTLFVENRVILRNMTLAADELGVLSAALGFASAVDAAASGSVFRAQAVLDLARGDVNASRASAEKALKANPKDGRARLFLADSLVEGNRDLAITEAETAKRDVPALLRANRVLARAYASMGRYASAMKVLDERLKVDPRSSEASILYGDLHHELQNVNDAASYYSRAINGRGSDAVARARLGELKFEVYDYAAAATAYRGVLDDKAATPQMRADAVAGLALTEMANKRYPDADKLLHEAEQRSPQHVTTFVVKAELALATGSESSATSFANRALELKGDESAALVTRARAAVVRKDLDAATRDMQAAIAIDPTDARLRAILAGMYLTLGSSSQAFTVMKQAMEIDPLNNAARFGRGLHGLSEGAQREAIDRFTKATKDPLNRSLAYSSIALLHYHLGEAAKASAAVEKALAADKANPSAHLVSSALALDAGDLEKAEASANAVLKSDRDSALGHLALARVRAKKADLPGARAGYEAALKATPSLITAKVELAGLDLQGAEKEGALAVLTEAFRLYPNSATTRRLLLAAGY